MKEATSELNSVVVVVLAIGVLMAFFYYTLWPLIKNNFDKNSQCSKAICESCVKNGEPSTDCETVKCHMEGSTEEFECTFKG